MILVAAGRVDAGNMSGSMVDECDFVQRYAGVVAADTDTDAAAVAAGRIGSSRSPQDCDCHHMRQQEKEHCCECVDDESYFSAYLVDVQFAQAYEDDHEDGDGQY